MEVTVRLKNPPPDATLWTIALCDWNAITLLHYVGWESRDYLDITEGAIFEVPSGLTFPLCVVRLQICKWNADRTALIELYYVQSYHPYLWDFDKGQWSNTPDPTYREVFIPQAGSYDYNVVSEKFEVAAVPEPEFTGFAISDYSKI